jgi:hypothetical protein
VSGQVATRERIKALAVVEAKRYALHPVFLVGVALNTVVLSLALTHHRDSILEPPVGPAFLVGVFGIVVGYRLARSLERTTEALASTPVDVGQRVAALCLACLVPATVGLLSGVAILVFGEQNGPWGYGTWSGHERVAIVLGQTAVASLGGPLLGIAAARWLRFPGAVVVAPVAVLTWTIVTNGWTASNQDSTGWLVARLFSPFAFFHTLDTDAGKPHAVESWRGDPWFFLVWLVLLCVFAAVVAMLKGADGQARDRLRRVLGVTVVAALASCALAVVTGPDHATYRDVNGISRI